MKNSSDRTGNGAALSERDAAMVRTIREITGRGSNVEIRRKGDGYSIMEVKKKNIAPVPQGTGKADRP